MVSTKQAKPDDVLHDTKPGRSSGQVIPRNSKVPLRSRQQADDRSAKFQLIDKVYRMRQKGHRGILAIT